MRESDDYVAESNNKCRSQGNGKVVGRFSEYHARRGACILGPVENGRIDGFEEVGKVRDIRCGDGKGQRVEQNEENGRRAV